MGLIAGTGPGGVGRSAKQSCRQPASPGAPPPGVWPPPPPTPSYPPPGAIGVAPPPGVLAAPPCRQHRATRLLAAVLGYRPPPGAFSLRALQPPTPSYPPPGAAPASPPPGSPAFLPLLRGFPQRRSRRTYRLRSATYPPGPQPPSWRYPTDTGRLATIRPTLRPMLALTYVGAPANVGAPTYADAPANAGPQPMSVPRPMPLASRPMLAPSQCRCSDLYRASAMSAPQPSNAASFSCRRRRSTQAKARCLA